MDMSNRDSEASNDVREASRPLISDAESGHNHNGQDGQKTLQPLQIENTPTRGGYSIVTIFAFLAGLFVFSAMASFVAVRLAARERSLHFLVIGDWGRNGTQNQTLVAQAMARKAEDFSPAFVISVGDNFYESGLNSANDKQFDTSFVDVYSQTSLQVPWFAVLGNHDYGEYFNDTKDLKKCDPDDKTCYLSPLHQLNSHLRDRDWRWHCERWYSLAMEEYDLEIFFIDTNPFIEEYHTEPWADLPGGINSESWQAQVLELESRMAASPAAWKIVIGHHPIRNQHLPFNTPELMANVEPVLLGQEVQAYFSGHEHNLQHMHVDGQPTHYIVSGAGSLTDYPADYWDNGGGRFQHQGSGYVACSLKMNVLNCDFLGLNNEVLYQIAVPRTL